MEVQGINDSNDLKWRKIIPNEGFQHIQGGSYRTTILYKNYILFLGTRDVYSTQNSHILVFDLDRDEWNMMIPKGESDVFYSEGFSACYFPKDKIVLYGGCPLVSRKNSEKKDYNSEEEQKYYGFDVKGKPGSARKKSAEKEKKPVSRAKSPAKKMKKNTTLNERGVLEMLVFDDISDEDNFFFQKTRKPHNYREADGKNFV